MSRLVIKCKSPIINRTYGNKMLRSGAHLEGLVKKSAPKFEWMKYKG